MNRRASPVMLSILILAMAAPRAGLAAPRVLCASQWTVVSSPNVSSSTNILYGAAAVSANDVWAVGLAGQSALRTRALFEHWDGQSWTVASAPPLEGGYPRAVSAVSGDDAWAVGVRLGPSGEDRTLAAHWDGTAWSRVATPNLEGEGFLRGVAAITASDVWAVGFGGQGFRAMAEHWDGGRWTLASVPEPASLTSELNGVAAMGPADVWAVGDGTNDADHARTLIQHWDGSGWSIVPSPNRTGMANTLQGVAVVSPSDVWAVGWSGTTTFPQRSLVEHWDGTRWTIVPTPAPAANLTSVAAVSPTNVWAAGFLIDGSNTTTVIEHWDGANWMVVPSPNPSPDENVLHSLTALPSGELWAVGSSQYPNSKTLIESACLS